MKNNRFFKVLLVLSILYVIFETVIFLFVPTIINFIGVISMVTVIWMCICRIDERYSKYRYSSLILYLVFAVLDSVVCQNLIGIILLAVFIFILWFTDSFKKF